MATVLTTIAGDRRGRRRSCGRTHCPATTGDGMDDGALEVTGRDVAASCHERLRGTTWYVEGWRPSLTRGGASKLAE